VPVELQITIPLDALTGQRGAESPQVPRSTRLVPSVVADTETSVAQLVGGGLLPAELAWEIITSSRAAKWWRRLFTAPTTGALIGGDPRRRRFDGFLAELIKLRDQRCRTPYCDAPVREFDHIHRWTDGGPTSYRNGRAVCSRCNQTREAPGWSIQTVGIDYPAAVHTVVTTTPTGHS
jgi:HNH endonuclease